MKRYILWLLILLSFSVPSLWACDSGYGTVYYQAYARNVGYNVITSVQAYSVGPDSQYDVLTIRQTDTLNQVQYVQPFTGTSPSPGQPASTIRTSDVRTYGWGNYQVQGYVSDLDTCTGRSYPPYTNGASPYTNIAQIIMQPLRVGVNSPIYIVRFPATQYPGGPSTVSDYRNDAYFTALGIMDNTAVATWTFTGNVSDFDISCTTCNSVRVTAKGTGHGACNVALTASYVANGRQSTTGSLIVVGPLEQPWTGPNGLQATHLAKPGGYESDWYYQVLNSCGTPMEGLAMHETFPNSFTYTNPSYIWNFPSAESWQNGADGGWADHIGQVNATNPTSLNPQNPLGNTLIYYGMQNIFVDPYTTPVDTFTQGHYQDHGGYK